MCRRVSQRASVENRSMFAPRKKTPQGGCRTTSCSRGRLRLGGCCSRRTPTSLRSRHSGSGKVSRSVGFCRVSGYADRTADRRRRTLPRGHDSERVRQPPGSPLVSIAAGCHRLGAIQRSPCGSSYMMTVGQCLESGHDGIARSGSRSGGLPQPTTPHHPPAAAGEPNKGHGIR